MFERSQSGVDRSPEGDPEDLLRADSVRPSDGADQPRVLHQVDGGHLPHHGTGSSGSGHGSKHRRGRTTSTYLVRT